MVNDIFKSSIGQKLSLLEVKSLMICFLQKYKFSMSKKGMEEVVVDQPFTLKCNPQIQFVERL